MTSGFWLPATDTCDELVLSVGELLVVETAFRRPPQVELVIPACRAEVFCLSALPARSP